MSIDLSIDFPRACSGAMYWGVPVIMPVAVMCALASTILAMPKSARYTRPESSSRTFWGFTSRWITPALWA